MTVISTVLSRLSRSWRKSIRPRLYRALRKTTRLLNSYLLKPLAPLTKRLGMQVARLARFAHHHLARRPHEHLRRRWGWYDRWHAWGYHRHVHGAIAAVYILVIGIMLFATYIKTFAHPSDLSNSWNFGTPANYTFDSGIEASGTSARLKAQNYSNDANTKALYHLDDNTGSTATDSSSNSNNASATGSPSWVTGNLNFALSFNGTSQWLTAADSASLSLTGANTIEGWTKFTSSFGANTHDQDQTILDKGSYRLYYDYTSGKVTYEMAKSGATSWTQRAGNGSGGSWEADGKDILKSQVAIGSNVYVGLGSGNRDGEVWKWDGSTWTQIGGDGLNSSWDSNPAESHEAVNALESNGNTLFAGLGSSTGDAEVWSCETSSSCSTWTKIGGDGISSSWNTNYEDVQSLAVGNNTLFAGLGTSAAGDAEVWSCALAACSSWTKIGGDAVNSSWANTTYEAVTALSYNTDNTRLYAGLGITNDDAEIWSCLVTACTTWTKEAGDALSSTWSGGINSVRALKVTGTGFGLVYRVGLGDDAGEADYWQYFLGWSQMGGDSLNSSWSGTNHARVTGITVGGSNTYVSISGSSGDGEVWQLNGSTWTKIGGDGTGSSPTGVAAATSVLYSGSTLYAGFQNSNSMAEQWSWNGTSWTKLGGNYKNRSWGHEGYTNITASTQYNGKLYVGTGTSATNAHVWEYNGSSWTIVGGSDLNSSWSSTATTHTQVSSMVVYRGNLYVGLEGSATTDGEVWRYNGSSWAKVGGDGVNSSWNNVYKAVKSLAAYNGNLYAGTGTDTDHGEVWRYNGSTWTQVGGDSLNSSWASGYTTVTVLTVYNGNLYAGPGSGADADVWRYNGSTWTNVSSGAMGTLLITALTTYNGKLYAAGSLTVFGNADIWEYNGSTWTQVGGDGLNSSWDSTAYNSASDMQVYNGELYLSTTKNAAGDGDVWRYNGSTWTQVGGDGLNSSWPITTMETVSSLSVYKGKLYAGTGNTANSDAQVWSVGDNNVLQSAATSQDTNWHHIAATFDGFTMKIFIDGVENASQSATGSMPDNSYPLLIGTGYGSTSDGVSNGLFAGTLDEIRISDTARNSFTTLPYSNAYQAVTLGAAVRKSGVWHWDSFTDSETTNGGAITYRVSTDEGSTWLYWNGSSWATSSGLSQSNPIATINSNISTIPVTVRGFMWQAVFKGDGTQQVTLNSVGATATSDLIEPATNASSITALKAAGGATLSPSAWTNGSSPYFSWTAGTDNESGVKGYCLYLGTDNTADPVSTKGLLGTSPVSTGGACQFAVSGTNIDLATPGYISTPLTTSNNSYYLRIKALDNASNVISTAASFNFRFDNTPPTNPAFITAPSGFVNNKAVTLTWPTVGGNAPADANAGLAGLQYKINATNWYGDSHSGTGDINDLLSNDGIYTTQDPPDFNNLAEGSNTVYFRTWDQAGNVTASYVTAAVKINTTGAPSEPQNVIATPSTNTTNSFAFSWTAPATFVGNASNITYCYTINTLPSAGTCTFTGAGATSLPAGPFATQPGANTFYIVAKDESSNINYASYTTATFTANTPAPGIPLNLDVVDASVKATSNWRLALTWEPPTNVGAGVANYQVHRSTNNITFTQTGTSSSTSYVDAGLSQQTYYYKVRACDSANNCGAFTNVVDKLPTGKFTTPATLVSEKPVVSNVTTRRASVMWSTDRTSDSRIAFGTESGRYGVSEVSVSAQVTLHQVDLDNLSAGTTYYLVAKWTDEDGNTGVSQEFTLQTDPAPSVKEISVTKLGLSNATIQFTSKNANKASLYYGKSDAFGGIKSINTSRAESTYSIEIDGLDDGAKYFYKLVTYDSEGFPYDGNIFVFTTPARPRITNLRFQPVSGEPTSTQEVSWQTNVPTNSIVTYGIKGSNGSDVLDSTMTTDHKIIIRSLQDNSEYFLFAQSRDRDGNLAVSDRQVFRTALDTRPPKISNIVVESTIRGTGAEARGQVIVSWTTDEPATSQVSYTEGSAATVFNNRTTEDAALSIEHIVIVSDLPTSRVFSVQPVSKDRAGNQSKGESQPAIIGRASDSILTIVLNSLRKVFGF